MCQTYADMLADLLKDEYQPNFLKAIHDNPITIELILPLYLGLNKKHTNYYK